MQKEWLTLPIEDAYICPEGHITNNVRRCQCGEMNLASLSRILNHTPEDAQGLLVDLGILSPDTVLPQSGQN